jgi:polysaccharide export outer membrane protein
LSRKDISQDVCILDGDSIVPPLSEASASDPPVSNSTFPDTFTIQVVIVGEVNRIGPQTQFILVTDLCLQDLSGTTTSAGTNSGGGPVTIRSCFAPGNGVTEIADIRNVQISRLNVRGQRTIVKANLLT